MKCCNKQQLDISNVGEFDPTFEVICSSCGSYGEIPQEVVEKQKVLCSR